jgi:FixJ family two-component response regulator
LAAADSLALQLNIPPSQHRDADLSKVPMISIVDDDELVREGTKALVRSLGYGAHTFASAEEFLSSSYVDDTSCLITDVQMEGLSGIELQRRLIAKGHRMPIIFITAFPDERTQSRVLNAGAIGFLSKPFSDENLMLCLATALASDGSGSTIQ